MKGITVESKIHFSRGKQSKKTLRMGERKSVPTGRVPRVAKLIALAIRFEQLVRDGVASDYAELARLGHVTRARITQITNLLNLAPDLQEFVLLLPRVENGRDPITERDLRPIAALLDWRKQRRAWNHLLQG